jgi:Ser/Thr protein kinase RdoA (MazF antagonist)
VDGTLKHAWWIADLAARVAAAGGPVAATCASRDGALAVEIAVGRTRYVASAFARVEGRVLADAVTREQAAAWGRGLARLHEHSTRLDPPPSLPRWSAVAEGSLRRLPTDRAVFGVVHGDPELDNVVWVDERTPIFVDLDDAAWSWFAADVCFALRDFAPLAGAPDTASQPVASFLAGYREIRSLGEEELTWLPLFGRAHALVTLGRLQRTLAEPSDPDWPDWATALRRRVEEVDARLRSALAS